ncbi:putative aspartic-type endopeptidase opsB [Yarrowia sp. E02]|nr:putative aspartic-type endopeptidase opsB [Yarrowia sp. E02]
MHFSSILTLTAIASYLHNRPDQNEKRGAPKPVLMSSNRKVVVAQQPVNLEAYTNYYKKVKNEHHKRQLFKLKRHLEHEEELAKRDELTETVSPFVVERYAYRNDYKADFLKVPDSDHTVGGILGVVSDVLDKAAQGVVHSNDIFSQIFNGLVGDKTDSSDSSDNEKRDQIEVETVTLTRLHTEYKIVCGTEVSTCTKTGSIVGPSPTDESNNNGGNNNGGNNNGGGQSEDGEEVSTGTAEPIGSASGTATASQSGAFSTGFNNSTAAVTTGASSAASTSASPGSSRTVSSDSASSSEASSAASSASVTSSAATPSATGDKYFEADVYAFSLYYFVDAYLGTPGQKNSLLVDTGSSDLWVIDEANGGHFNKNKSSTWKHLNWDFKNAYQAGQISGEWGSDSVTINDATVDDLVMGVANTSALTSGDNVMGLLGLGFEGLEGTQQTDIGQYKNYPRRLVDSGLTDVAAYSVWLNSRQTGQGNFLFGGVDTAKYEGELQTIDMPDVVVGNMRGYLTTHMTNIAINNPNGSVSNLPKDIYAMFDTGAPSTLLPDDVGLAFKDQFNLSYNSAWGLYYGDCNQGGTFTFTLGGKDFTMDVKDFVVDWVSAKIPEGQCFFGIGPTRGKMAMFGDTFLRSFYAVFDLDNRKASLAKAKTDIQESNIVAIPAGGVEQMNLGKRDQLPAAEKVHSFVVPTVSIPSPADATASIPAF